MAKINDRGGRASRHLADQLLEATVDSLRISADLRRRVLARLDALSAEMVAALIEGDPSAVVQSAARDRRLARVLEAIKAASATAYADIAEMAGATLEDVAELAAARTVTAISGALDFIDASAPVTLPAAAARRAVQRTVLTQGAPHGTWWDRQSAGLIQQFEDQMREGLAQGDTIPQLIQRVRGGVRGGLPVEGFMRTTKGHAARIVRTAVMAHANAAHQQVLEANADFFEVWVHISTLDGRTSRHCIPRDGKTWDKQKRPIGHHIPFRRSPIHWRCRSLQTMRFKGAGPTTPARASEDGPVPSNWNSGRWLREKPVTYQDRVLGKEIARLWRGRKISLTQTLDFSGRPKTAAQIKEELGLKDDTA